MRLKEIKPGMVIHCKNDEEKKALLEEAERLGYVWYRTKDMPTDYISSAGNTIYFYGAGTTPLSVDYKYITHSCSTNDVTNEFSDLILPELTAEEAIEWLAQHRLDDEYENAFGFTSPFYEIINEKCTAEDIVKGIAQWKSEHEKKEPEIETEWFWQGRIFKILEDGCYYQIKDGTGFYDTGCEYRESAEEYMKDELKEYCKTHEGEFIAVVEHVCRVKAVE